MAKTKVAVLFKSYNFALKVKFKKPRNGVLF
jgi:hypothetical protein